MPGAIIVYIRYSDKIVTQIIRCYITSYFVHHMIKFQLFHLGKAGNVQPLCSILN